MHVGELLDASLATDDVAHFQRQIRVLLLLADLQARQMRMSAKLRSRQPHTARRPPVLLQFHPVAVLEVLRDGAFDRLALFRLQRECLRLGTSSRDIAHAILALDRAAMVDLDLETLDFLGELHSLTVGEWSLLVFVDFENFEHEINDRLFLIERRGRYCQLRN